MSRLDLSDVPFISSRVPQISILPAIKLMTDETRQPNISPKPILRTHGTPQGFTRTWADANRTLREEKGPRAKAFDEAQKRKAQGLAPLESQTSERRLENIQLPGFPRHVVHGLPEEKQQKLDALTQKFAAAKATQGGVMPPQAALQMSPYREALVRGHLDLDTVTRKVTPLWEEAHYANKARREGVLEQLREVPYPDGDKKQGPWALVGQPMPTETRSQRLAANAAAQPMVQEWFRKTAANASRLSGRTVSESMLRQFVPNLSDQQLAAVLSQSPITGVIAGPGAGKTNTMVAQFLDDLFNRSDSWQDVLSKVGNTHIISKTHSAVNNVLDKFQGIESIIPEWTAKQRQSQARTLDSWMMSQLTMKRDGGPSIMNKQFPGFLPLGTKEDTEDATHKQLGKVLQLFNKSGNVNVPHLATYIEESKGKQDAEYRARLARGAHLFKNTKWQQERGIEPDLALYLYQQSLWHRPGFQTRSGQGTGPLYDLADAPIMMRAAIKAGNGPQGALPRAIFDEFQDISPSAIETLVGLSGEGSRQFYGGDMGQMSVQRDWRPDQALQQAGGSNLGETVLTGNYRSPSEVVAVMNALRARQAVAGRAVSPPMISMKGASGHYPITYVEDDVPATHRRMALNWFDRMGTSIPEVARKMRVGRARTTVQPSMSLGWNASRPRVRTKILPGVHPLAGFALPAQQRPLVFQMRGKGLDAFTEQLHGLLSEHMEPHLATKFINEYTTTEPARPGNINKMHRTMLTDIRSRQAAEVHNDATQGGLWSDADFTLNQGTQYSRATQQNIFYGSATNFPGNQHNVTPESFSGQQVPAGFGALLGGAAEDLAVHQEVDPRSMPMALQNSFYGERQLYPEPGQMRSQQNQQLMSKYIEDTISLSSYHPPDAEDSGAFSAGSVERGFTSSGYSITGRNGIGGGGGYQKGTPQLLEAAERELNNLMAQGSQMGDVPSFEQLMSQVGQSFAYSGKGEVGDAVASSEFGQDNRVVDFAPRDHGSYQGKDITQLRNQISEILGIPEMRDAPEVQKLLAQFHTDPRVLKSIERTVTSLAKTDPTMEQFRHRLGVALMPDTKLEKHHKRVEELERHAIRKVSEGRDTRFSQLMNRDQFGLSEAERAEIERSKRHAIKKGLSPTEQKEHADLSRLLRVGGVQNLQEMMRAVTTPAHESQGVGTPAHKNSLKYFNSALASTIFKKEGELLAQGRIDPHMLGTLAHHAEKVASTVANPEESQMMLKAADLFRKHTQHTGEGGLPFAEADLAHISPPIDQALVRHIMTNPKTKEFEGFGSEGTQSRIDQLPYQKASMMRTLNAETGPALGVSMQQSRLSSTVGEGEILHKSIRGGLDSGDYGIFDPEVLRATTTKENPTEDDYSYKYERKGASLEGMQKRLQDRLERHDLPAHHRQKIHGMLAKIQQIDEGFGNPRNQQNWAQLMGAVLGATTGENPHDRTKGQRGADPIRKWYRNREANVSDHRTLESLVEFMTALNQASSHLQQSGTLKRSHLQRVVRAFGFNMDDERFKVLRNLEKMPKDPFISTRKNPDPEVSLQAIIGQLPAAARKDAQEQLTRVPLLPGNTTYSYMGGQPGYAGIGYGMKGNSQTELFREAGIAPGTPLEGTLHPLPGETEFGLSKQVMAHRNLSTFSPEGFKQQKAEHWPSDMQYQPIVQFQSTQGISFPVTPDQLALKQPSSQQPLIAEMQQREDAYRWGLLHSKRRADNQQRTIRTHEEIYEDRAQKRRGKLVDRPNGPKAVPGSTEALHTNVHYVHSKIQPQFNVAYVDKPSGIQAIAGRKEPLFTQVQYVPAKHKSFMVNVKPGEGGVPHPDLSGIGSGALSSNVGYLNPPPTYDRQEVPAHPQPEETIYHQGTWMPKEHAAAIETYRQKLVGHPVSKVHRTREAALQEAYQYKLAVLQPKKKVDIASLPRIPASPIADFSVSRPSPSPMLQSPEMFVQLSPKVDRPGASMEMSTPQAMMPAPRLPDPLLLPQHAASLIGKDFSLVHERAALPETIGLGGGGHLMLPSPRLVSAMDAMRHQSGMNLDNYAMDQMMKDAPTLSSQRGAGPSLLSASQPAISPAPSPVLAEDRFDLSSGDQMEWMSHLGISATHPLEVPAIAGKRTQPLPMIDTETHFDPQDPAFHTQSMQAIEPLPPHADPTHPDFQTWSMKAINFGEAITNPEMPIVHPLGMIATEPRATAKKESTGPLAHPQELPIPLLPSHPNASFAVPKRPTSNWSMGPDYQTQPKPVRLQPATPDYENILGGAPSPSHQGYGDIFSPLQTPMIGSYNQAAAPAFSIPKRPGQYSVPQASGSLPALTRGIPVSPALGTQEAFPPRVKKPTPLLLPQHATPMPLFAAEPKFTAAKDYRLRHLPRLLREGGHEINEVKLHHLAPEQRGVLESQAHHQIIQGGPGTGKTDMVITKLADLIGQRRLSPRNILAFSGLHSGVEEINKRYKESLQPLLPRGEAHQVPSAQTFHSVAHQIMMPHGQPSPLLKDIGRDYIENIIANPSEEELSKMNPEERASASNRQSRFLQTALEERLPLGTKGMPKTMKDLEYHLKEIGSWKRGRFGDSSKYKEAMERGQGHLDKGIMSKHAALAAYEQALPGAKSADFDDSITVARELLEARGMAAIPDHLKGTQAIAYDEAQDASHEQVALLGSLQKALGTQSRTIIGLDPMQSLFQGAGAIPPEDIIPTFKNTLGDDVAHHQLIANFRSPQSDVAVYNAVLGQSDNPLSPPQIPYSSDPGRPVKHILAKSEPHLYQKIFGSMLEHTGVPQAHITKNIVAGRHPFHGVDWSQKGLTKPGEIPLFIPKKVDRRLFEATAPSVLEKLDPEENITPGMAISAFKQIYRGGPPRKSASDEERDAYKNKEHFLGLMVGQARSKAVKFPHAIVGRTGLWKKEENRQSYLNNLGVAVSRVSEGGHQVFAAASRPFETKHAEKYLESGGEHFLEESPSSLEHGRVFWGPGEQNFIHPHPATNFETHEGETVASGFKKILGAQQLQLAQWSEMRGAQPTPTPEPEIEPPAPAPISPTSTLPPSMPEEMPLPPSQKKSGALFPSIEAIPHGATGEPRALSHTDKQAIIGAMHEKFQARPQRGAWHEFAASEASMLQKVAGSDHPVTQFAQEIALSPKKYAPPAGPTPHPSALPSVAPSGWDKVQGDVVRGSTPRPTSTPSQTPPVVHQGEALPAGAGFQKINVPPGGNINIQGTDIKIETKSNTTSFGGASAGPSTGAGSAFNFRFAGTGGSLVPHTASGLGGSNTASSGGDDIIIRRGGGAPPSGPPGGSDKDYATPFFSGMQQAGRSIARVSSEMQYFGKMFTDITNAAAGQGSEYRRATTGMPGAGTTADRGFFDFSNSQSGISQMSANLPMYSTVQNAQMLRNTASQTGGFGINVGTATTYQQLGAVTGMDPTQLMQQGAYYTGTTGQGMSTKGTNNLVASMEGLYGGNLTATNVAPTMQAINSVMPSMQGNALGQGNQLKSLMTMFGGAMAGGATAQNLPDIAGTIGNLTQIGMNPDLRQQYTMSKMFPGQLTAGTQLAQFNQQQLGQSEQVEQLSLQKAVNLPGLQIKINNADIAMQSANFDLAKMQQSYNEASYANQKLNYQYSQASFQEQQYVANQEYGPIGADTGRNSYFDFMRNQQAAGYNPLSAETGTQFKPSAPQGIQNMQFYAGVEHQRQDMVLSRSPLLSDAKFQEDMKYLNEQEAFYKEQLDLTNQQRKFEVDWTTKLLASQGDLLAMQGPMLAQQGKILNIQGQQLDLNKAMTDYQNQSLTIQQKYLPMQLDALLAIQKATGEYMGGQGPLNGQNMTPEMLIKQLVGVKDDKAMRQDVQAMGLSPADTNNIIQIVEGVKKTPGGWDAVQKGTAPQDKALQKNMDDLKKSGAFTDQKSQAAMQDAYLKLAGTSDTWAAFSSKFDTANDYLKTIAQDSSGLSPIMKDISTALTILGPVLMGIALFLNTTGTAGSVASTISNVAPGILPAIGTGLSTAATAVAPIVAPLASIAGGLWAGSNLPLPTSGMGAGVMDALVSGVLPSTGLALTYREGQQQWGKGIGDAWNWLTGGGGPNNAHGGTATQGGAGAHGGAGLNLPHGSIATLAKGPAGKDVHAAPQTDISKSLLKGIQTGWDAFWKTEAGKDISGFFSGLSKNFGNLVGTVWTFFTKTLPTKFGEFIDGLKTNLSGFWQWIKLEAGVVWDGISKWFIDYIWKPFEGFTKAVLNIPVEIGNAINSITNFFSPTGKNTLWTLISGALKNINWGNMFNIGGGAGGGGGSEPPGHPGFTTPHVNTEYGVAMSYGKHQGVDFQASQGTQLKEFVGGKVSKTGWYEWGGEVDVAVPGGLTERYLHLSAIGVKKGDVVGRGEYIGLTGGGTKQSGLGKWSTGSHLHVQYDHGNYDGGINPWQIWRKFGDMSLAGYLGQVGKEGVSPGSGGAKAHFAMGGIALHPMKAQIGELEAEAVIPLSKLSETLKSLPKTGSAHTTSQTTTQKTSVAIDKLIGSATFTVHAASGTMSDAEKDQLMSDVMDVITEAAKQLYGKLQ